MKRLIFKIFLLALCFSSINPLLAQRIITAGSSNTEIVCALGLCDNIVATDRTSLYPVKMQSLPSIGYRTTISAEGILSLNPDVVILEKDYVKESVIEQLKGAGQKVLILETTYNLDNTKDRIQQVATTLKREKEGEALVTSLMTDLKTLQDRVAATPDQPKVLCVYNRGAGNMQVAGKNTGFTVISLAGTKNAVPEIDGFKPLNAESLIAANPDYILFFESGIQSLGGIEGALKIPGVAQTTAGKKRQILAIDGVKLTNWGPRVIEVANQIFELTHPEAN